MTHHKLLLATALGLVPLGAAVGIATATPAADVAPEVHAAGVALEPVTVNADRIKFQTKDPVDLSVLTLTLQPGGTTGWHSHPGLALIAVTDGAGTLTDAACRTRTYRAGQAFAETGDDEPTVFRNPTADPVVLTVTFVAPEGRPALRDEPAPAGCAVR